MWIFNLLFLIFANAQSEPATEVGKQNTIKLEREESLADNKPWSLFGELALESKKQNLGSQRQDSSSGVQNFSLGMEYQFDPSLLGHFEILGQQDNDEANVSLGEVYVNYSPESVRGLNFSVGNMYYSYGVLTGYEGLYSRRPDYYSDLLVTRRGIDLGAEVSFQPLSSLPLNASYSYFSGRTLRSGDNNLENADINPQYLKLTYSPSFLKAQLVYLNRRYQRSPTFRATGLMFNTPHFEFWKKRIRFSGQSEFWQLNYERGDQFERSAFTQLFGGYFEIFHLFYRGLYSREDWSSPGLQNIRSNFALNGVGVRINKYIFFEYQNIQSQELQSQFQIRDIDENNWRLFLQF